jgi:hypothetical protein
LKGKARPELDIGVDGILKFGQGSGNTQLDLAVSIATTTTTGVNGWKIRN